MRLLLGFGFPKLMGAAVLLASVAVAVNTLAFKTADVNNPVSFDVVATGSAALAIAAGATPGSGFTTNNADDFAITITDDLQPNSVYKFAQVFKVTNNNANVVTANYTINSAPAGVTVKLYETGTSTELINKALANLATVTLDVELTLANTAVLGAGQSLTIQIKATE